jgi:N-acetylglutamate synthase-like GNAT family acetyltransferase
MASNKIKNTDDYERLVPFFINNGLEFSEEDEVPTDIVSCYVAEFGDGACGSGEQTRVNLSKNVSDNNERRAPVECVERMECAGFTEKYSNNAKQLSDCSDGVKVCCRSDNIAGAAVLALREGKFICDGIATDERVRGMGLGKALLDMLISDVKERSGNALFLVARAPEFFAKYGFVSVPRNDAPNFFECFTCPQYKETCFPEVMRLGIN